MKHLWYQMKKTLICAGALHNVKHQLRKLVKQRLNWDVYENCKINCDDENQFTTIINGRGSAKHTSVGPCRNDEKLLTTIINKVHPVVYY